VCRDAIAGVQLPGKPQAFPETPAQHPEKTEVFLLEKVPGGLFPRADGGRMDKGEARFLYFVIPRVTIGHRPVSSRHPDPATAPHAVSSRRFHTDGQGIRMVKLTVRERESIQEAVRRFRKLVERSGIKKEMRRREFFEKPSETKRRARLRAERRTKRNRLLGVV
jgi:small subunit ribosomal protein S21